LDPKSALRSENTRPAAAELGVKENTIRGASAQAPASPLWFFYHPRALSVKSSTLPWSAVGPCAAAGSKGRPRLRSVSSPPLRSIARGTTRTKLKVIESGCRATGRLTRRGFNYDSARRHFRRSPNLLRFYRTFDEISTKFWLCSGGQENFSKISSNPGKRG
jgi:hypothetical protein